VGELKKTSILLSFFTFFILFSTASKALGFYNDWRFFNIVSNGADQYIFFSTRFMNETKYFVIRSVYIESRIYIYRFDYFGVLEEARNMSTSGFIPLGNSLLINKPDDILMPMVNTTNNHLLLVRFNITKYQSGDIGLDFMDLGKTIPTSGLGIGNVNFYQDAYSISTIMSKEAYPSGIVTVGNHTFGIAYISSDGRLKVVWDFYDLDTSTLSLSNMHEMAWDTGLSGIKKIYLYSSEGNCFYYSDCVFQILFEGKSEQNSNNEGIYVREGRKGAFGWEFMDKGLIGWNTAEGFYTQLGGTDYWYHTHHYPFLARKIFLRQKYGSERVIAHITYSPSWIPIQEERLNTEGSNAFMPNAKQLSNSTINYFTYDLISLKNQTYAYFITLASISGGAPVGNITFTVTDSYNSSNSNSLSLPLQPSYHPDNPQNYGQNFVRLKLPPSQQETYNLTVYVNRTGGGNYTLMNVYLDVLGDSSWAAPYRSATNFFLVTEDNAGEMEAYFLYNAYEGFRGLGFIYNGTNANGIQTVKTACRCTLWTTDGCYNSTHRMQTRSCSPPACSDEYRLFYDDTCSGVPPTKPLQCMDINQSGFYVLQNDTVADRDICIWIKASDVTLDLNGHTLSGAKTGILVQPETPTKLKNIVIRNGEIHGFEKGIFISYTENSSISSINFTSNQVALWLGGETRGIEIKGNKFSVTPYLNAYGIRVEGYTRDNLIEDNEFMDMTANIYVPNGALYFSRIINNKFGNVTVFPECCVEKTIWLLPFPVPVSTKTCVVPCGQIYNGALSGIICNDCGYNDFVGNYYFANNTDATFSNSEGNRFIYEAFERIPNSTNGLFLDQSTKNNWGCSVQGNIYDSGVNNTFVSTCPSTLYPNQTIYCVAGWKCVDNETIGYQMSDCSWYETHKCPSGKICVEGVCTSIAPPPAPPMPPEAPYEPVTNRTLFTEAGADWMAFFFTPIFFATIMLIGISGFITLAIAKYGGGQFAPAAFIIISMIMVAIYGMSGIYPTWLVIVLIILAGFVFAKFILGVI
jgi:hypothetical protein